MSNYQATSAPYSLDSVKPHDKQANGWSLVWVREFGTNVNADIGDAYNSSGEADLAARVNPRLGMLEVELDEAQASAPEWRGQTFLFPDWSQVPINIQSGLRHRTLFAHVLADGASEPNTQEVALLLGATDMFGNTPTASLESHALQAQPVTGGGPGVFPRSNYLGSEWPDAVTENQQNSVERWGESFYIRILMITDDKQSESTVWISQDGLGWLNVGQLSSLPAFQLYRRVGLALRSPSNEDEVMARLDWVRLYDATDPNLDVDPEAISQIVAQTGSRLFVD